MRAPPLLRFLTLTLVLYVVRASAADASVSVATQQAYRGWADAIIMRNRTVEVIIVPSVGRVMQFRFAGEKDGPLWENEGLAGQVMPKDPWKASHGSFGGDKTWPSPQSLWNWPPPDIFDVAALTAKVNDDHSVTLTSPESPRFGLRTVRRVVLDPAEPAMRIETTYEKISGEPASVGVWVITQFRHPTAVFMPVPKNSQFPTGHAPTWKGPAEFLRREGDWLRITRNPAGPDKTGNDGTSLVWAGERELLRIDIPRTAGGDYAHGGCSVEVYTNPDPVPYVELETLGPRKTLRPGDRLSATNTYRLVRRTSAPLEQDVRALLAR
jgi:hypothetical protein